MFLNNEFLWDEEVFGMKLLTSYEPPSMNQFLVYMDKEW